MDDYEMIKQLAKGGQGDSLTNLLVGSVSLC